MKKTSLFLIIAAIGLILLRPHGGVTGARVIDSSILRLESSVRQYAESAMAYMTGGGSDGVEAINDENTLAGRLTDRLMSVLAGTAPSASSSLSGGESQGRSGDLVVRAGVFRDHANAEALVRTLRESNFDARSYVLDGDLHAVAIGPFLETSIAEKTARSVSETTGLSPIVIRSDSPPR